MPNYKRHPIALPLISTGRVNRLSIAVCDIEPSNPIVFLLEGQEDDDPLQIDLDKCIILSGCSDLSSSELSELVSAVKLARHPVPA